MPAACPMFIAARRLKVWIKLHEGQSLNADDALRDFLKDKLSPIEMPKMIEFRDKPLPKTLIGKLSRKDLDRRRRGEDAKKDEKRRQAERTQTLLA